MERRRCRWVNLKNPRYIRYHDEEWGRPHYDDGYLFELLVLESFQAGLSWECILNKRESFRTAFDGFDCRKVAAYTQEHPDNKIIKMGIGDVTMPLAPAVIEAMHQATEEQAHKETFHGYSPDSDGYPFLREAIANYYKNFGVDMDPSEVFVGDGAKSDVGNIVDLFDVDNTVLVPDPVYPVYVDTNIISGRNIAYMDANEQNGFLPLPDESVKADIIYLCSPNNPTGATSVSYTHLTLPTKLEV